MTRSRKRKLRNDDDRGEDETDDGEFKLSLAPAVSITAIHEPVIKRKLECVAQDQKQLNAVSLIPCGPDVSNMTKTSPMRSLTITIDWWNENEEISAIETENCEKE